MAKFVIVTEKNGDIFTQEFDDQEKAVAKATSDWDRLSSFDKTHTEEFFVLESVNPDEEAENHLDGDIVIDIKNR